MEQNQEYLHELSERLGVFLERGMRKRSAWFLKGAIELIEDRTRMGMGGQILIDIPRDTKDYPDIIFTPGELWDVMRKLRT